MEKQVVTAGTSTDSRIHVGLPDGKTICGRPVSYQPRQSAVVDCPVCEKLAERMVTAEAIAEPDRTDELMEEMVAWHQGLMR